MAVETKINVALAGLSFGAEFVPIFLHHPMVESLTHLRRGSRSLAKDRRPL